MSSMASTPQHSRPCGVCPLLQPHSLLQTNVDHQ
jgi:hypothetical protein